MAPRFDAQAHRLELSVADVLQGELGAGAGAATRGGMERLWLGQAIHGRYQERALAADPSYRREVELAHEFECAGWRVALRGRADGVRRGGDGGLVVEEVKSVRAGRPLGPASRLAAERQVGLYAWLLSRSSGEPARAELVLIEIGSDAVDAEALEIDLGAVEAELRRSVEELLRAWEDERRARDARRAASGALAFPYPEPRPVQDEIAEAVARALERREHLLVQAPTGVGKTVAALYPALRFALGEDARVFVLTSKNLQQEMAVRVLELLNAEADFRAVRLRAKARMCANEQLLCHEDYCRYLREYALRLRRARAVERVFEAGPIALPAAVWALGRSEQLCPFELSLAAARAAQVVVCDYNYAFDPWLALGDFAPGADLAHTLLVIDEIHNLVDRGRDYYSPELHTSPVGRVAEWSAAGGAPLADEIAAVCEALDALVWDTLEAAEPAGARKRWAVEHPLPEEALLALRSELDRVFVGYLEQRTRTRSLQADDPFVALYFDVLRFLGVLVRADARFSSYVERQGKEARLKLLCRDPSRFLGGVLNRCASAIGLSATLSPVELHRDLLGLDRDRTSSLVLANPFPPENRQVVVDPTVSTTFRERAAHYDRIAERLSAFADAVPGNCLALFPSYAFLREVAARAAPLSKRVLLQRPDDTELEREGILAALRGAAMGDVLLLAACGGVFAEGVDYPGDALRAVAVVGPCLPALTLDRELLRGHYDEAFERGFEYAFVVPGMTRVLQAAGRLIRSERDSGVIALFGRRFLEPPYADYLPPEWVPEEGIAALAGDPAAAAARFFGARARPPRG